MSPRPGTLTVRPPKALPVETRRNLIVQAAGLGMVLTIMWPVMPWRLLVAWLLTAVAVIAAEGLALRRAERGGRYADFAKRAAPVLRVAVTWVYAFAALVLVSHGAAIPGGWRIAAGHIQFDDPSAQNDYVAHVHAAQGFARDIQAYLASVRTSDSAAVGRLSSP